MQFGGNQENPWQCLQCGSAFDLPSLLLGAQSEVKPPRAAWEQSGATHSSTQYVGTRAAERRAAGISKGTLFLRLLTGLPRFAMMLGAVFAIVLAAHSLYVRLNAVEGMLPVGKEGADLFLEVDMPSGLASVVHWCSTAGLSSWSIPAVFIFDACLLWVVWYWSRRRGIGSRRV